MRSSMLSVAALALAVASRVLAQTFTDCDPTKKTCPPDKALGKTIDIDFTQGASDQFTLASSTSLKYGPNGAEFTIVQETDAPTITSIWYIFFGRVDVTLQAAPGTGIVSSFVMQSDVLDEIDMEWLGGNTAQVETNYFGKGNTTTYDRATYENVASPQTSFHTYSVDWTSSYIKWFIDGNLVRTLNYADANGGKNFPQTPMQVKLGNWVGGGSKSPEGTVQWAGGRSDMTKGPFTMYVKSIKIQDYTTGGAEYVYSDMSGDWQSIKTSGSSSDSGSSSASDPSSTSSPAASDPSSTSSPAASTESSTYSTTSSTFSTASSITSEISVNGSSISIESSASGVSGAITPTSPGSNFTATSTNLPSTTRTSSSATAIRVSGYSAGCAILAALGIVLGYIAA